jgi:hypothetical protein
MEGDGLGLTSNPLELDMGVLERLRLNISGEVLSLGSQGPDETLLMFVLLVTR